MRFFFLVLHSLWKFVDVVYPKTLGEQVGGFLAHSFGVSLMLLL